MNRPKYEFVVVGSGAGGGTLAGELSRRGKKVAVVERGHYERDIGTFQDALRMFDFAGYDDFDAPFGLKERLGRLMPSLSSLRGGRLSSLGRKLPGVGGNLNVPGLPRKSKEGVITWRGIVAGGTTVLSCGNGARCMQKELAAVGVELEAELQEAEQDLHIQPTPEGLFSEGSRSILRASAKLGYQMQPMPKFVNPVTCTRCGFCIYGCRQGAKWTSLNYLDEAIRNGTDVIYGTTVSEVIIRNGKAVGVKGLGPDGPVEVFADAVIVSAGGLESAAILQRSGLREAGKGLFVDLMITTYGETDGRVNQVQEPIMAVVDLEFEAAGGFLLAPYVNHHRLVRYIELGPKQLTVSAKNLVGIMTKIVDEPVGQVFPDGTFSRPVTARDRRRLDEGAGIAKRILTEVGAKPSSLVDSKVQGAHPGGAAAIGQVVDKDLQTAVSNLFVCDASVFPAISFPDSSRLPPIVSLVALAKRLAKTLAGASTASTASTPSPASVPA